MKCYAYTEVSINLLCQSQNLGKQGSYKSIAGAK